MFSVDLMNWMALVIKPMFLAQRALTVTENHLHYVLLRRGDATFPTIRQPLALILCRRKPLSRYRLANNNGMHETYSVMNDICLSHVI